LETDFRDYISSGQLRIINKDCLEVDYSAECIGDFVLVGNIPYYITGAIFRHTFEQQVLPKQAILLVQKEVAQRVVARESGKVGKESLLSVSVKIFVENEKDVEIVDYVKAGSFSPPPKVDSAILNIKNIKNTFKSREEYESFFKTLKVAFSQKRKFLMSNLKQKLSKEIFEKYENIFEEIFVKRYGEKVRAEDIGVNDWTNLVGIIF
jgi:16S rRNA (adenine1518-N6/adenine1519-N6)-dimethyltransferase